jgi:hypothetical protein
MGPIPSDQKKRLPSKFGLPRKYMLKAWQRRNRAVQLQP